MFEVSTVVEEGNDIYETEQMLRGDVYMKRMLFIILIFSLFFAACSNLEYDRVVETPKTDNFIQPDSINSTDFSTEFDIPNESSNITNNIEGFIDEPDQPLGGGDFTFDRLFVESTNDTAFTDQIVGRDELSKFIDEYVEPYKFEKQNLPHIYKIIQHFNIPKETFIEYNNKMIIFNKEYGTDGTTYEDYVIDALYCGDVEKMRLALKSPYALYQNHEFYTIYDLFKMKPEEIVKLGLPQEELSVHTAKVYDAMKYFGYDNEVTREYFDTLSENIKLAQKLIISDSEE